MWNTRVFTPVFGVYDADAKKDEIMKNIPQISVLMSVYNQKKPEQLEAAIQSVLKQTFADFEFIIYNDGSDEETSARLQKYRLCRGNEP